MLLRHPAAGLLLFMVAAPVSAHYHLLLPQKASTDRDRPLRFMLGFGHPFEHQLFPTQKPKFVSVITPGGKCVDVSDKLEKDATGGYRWSYTPAERGDHVVFVRCEPEWMAEEKKFFDDSAKVILHVQTQNGWDRPVGGNLPPDKRPAPGEGIDLVPLTRPYGLRAGTVFQVVVLSGIADPVKGLADTFVEFERYNAAPPKELPPDEQITRTVKSDPNGVATVTLPEPGWWGITAGRDGGTRIRDGKSYPVKVRTTLWVFVDDK
jgi:cobalt/nickel transport protein